MPVNRYDQASIAPYVEQYTPIPFDTLYKLGQVYNAQRDATETAFQTALQQYREFNSPSAVDTQRWYDLTVKPASQLASEVAANPDILRTPEGRRRIQNFINTRPYAELSQLEQSRQNMLQRQKNIQELIKDGTYYEPWHNVSMTNYDTLRQGLFNDINVTPYSSTAELVKPYIDGIKDSYIRTQGGFDYYGVTPEQIQTVIGANMNSLLTSPQGREYMRQFIRAGYSPEDAQALLANNLTLAASRYAHENRRTNPFATMQYNDQLIRSRWADPNNPANRDKNPDDPRNPRYLTNQIQTTGDRTFLNGRIDIIARNPNYRTAVEHLNSKDPVLQEQGRTELQALYDAYQSPQQLFRYVFDQHGTVTDKGGLQMNTGQVTAATNDVLNNFSTPISGTYGDLLLNTIPGISVDAQTTPLGKYRTLSSGANLDLATRSIAAIAGLNPTPSGRSKFLNELKGGGLNNMIVLSNERILTIPIKDRFGKDTSLSMQTIRVAISADEAKARGLTDSDMKQAGAVLYTKPGKTTTSSTLSGDYDNDDAETKFNKATTSTSTTNGNNYWVVNLTSEVPMEAVGAEYLNQSALKSTVNPTTYSELYQDVQDQAFPWVTFNENNE